MKNLEGKEVTTKPWQSVEWKKKREELLGDNCAQCGSTKTPFVLHHLQRTIPTITIWHVVAASSFNECVSRGLIKIPNIARNRCPSCSSVNVRQRQFLKPPWTCNKCHSTFDLPTQGFQIDTKEEGRAFREFKAINKDMITEKARALAKEQHTRYMSCKETATFCQKCAFFWDMKGMNLCPKCKVHYKKFRFPYCFTCSKELGLVHPTLRERLGVTEEEEAEWDRELDQMNNT